MEGTARHCNVSTLYRVVSFMLWPLYPRGKSPSTKWTGEFSRAQNHHRFSDMVLEIYLTFQITTPPAPLFNDFIPPSY